MNDFDSLLETLTVIDDAVWEKDKDRAFEAVTIFLMQYVEVIGHSSTFMEQSFPFLEQLKDCIQSEEWEDATVLVLAFKAKLREARLSPKQRKLMSEYVARFGYPIPAIFVREALPDDMLFYIEEALRQNKPWPTQRQMLSEGGGEVNFTCMPTNLRTYYGS